MAGGGRMSRIVAMNQSQRVTAKEAVRRAFAEIVHETKQYQKCNSNMEILERIKYPVHPIEMLCASVLRARNIFSRLINVECRYT